MYYVYYVEIYCSMLTVWLLHMEADCSWRGSVANESNHCIIGKQIKSCERLLLSKMLSGLNSGQHSVWGHYELGSASLITDYTSLSDLKQCSKHSTWDFCHKYYIAFKERSNILYSKISLILISHSLWQNLSVLDYDCFNSKHCSPLAVQKNVLTS